MLFGYLRSLIPLFLLFDVNFQTLSKNNTSTSINIQGVITNSCLNKIQSTSKLYSNITKIYIDQNIIPIFKFEVCLKSNQSSCVLNFNHGLNDFNRNCISNDGYTINGTITKKITEKNIIINSGICLPLLCTNRNDLNFITFLLEDNLDIKIDLFSDINFNAHFTLLSYTVVFFILFIMFILFCFSRKEKRNETMEDQDYTILVDDNHEVLVVNVMNDVKPTLKDKLLIAFNIKKNIKSIFISETKYKFLDGLRGFAMLYVILDHSFIYYRSKIGATGNLYFISNGTYGVDIFFVLSGFLISYVLDRDISLVQFYFRRIFRIYPIYICAIIFDWLSNTYSTCNKDFYFNLLGINNFTSKVNVELVLEDRGIIINHLSCLPQSWSIGVELQMYIITPIIIYLMKRNGNVIAITIILIAFLTRFCLLFSNIGPSNNYEEYFNYVYYNTFTRMDAYICGLLAYNITHSTENRKEILIKYSKIIIYILEFIAMIIIFTILIMPYDVYYNTFSGNTFLITIFSRFPFILCLMLLIIFKIKYNTGLLCKIMSYSIWTPFAKLSYSMYLVHHNIINLFMQYSSSLNIKDDLLSSFVFFIIIVSISFGISIFTYCLIEVPLIKLQRNLFSK
jgi:peptidoglycan/LPS O-acetylase OafA/YrhL/cbb3-type cytochrome oxidase subunit 3